MASEIERKFLDTNDAWRKLVKNKKTLHQGFLTRGADAAVVRVRIEDDKRGWLTVKSAGSGLARDEYEYDIPIKDARMLLKLCGKHVIAKTRHLLPVDELTWEIDEFEGRHEGLIIAEVELPSSDHKLRLPPWVGREVTGKRKFSNVALARPSSSPRHS